MTADEGAPQTTIDILDLYRVGRQHADGSITLPWEIVKAWAERAGLDPANVTTEHLEAIEVDEQMPLLEVAG